MVNRLTFLERILHRLHLLPTPIMDTFAGVLFGRVLAIAVRRGLFDALASGPMNAAEIAAVTHFHPRALALVLNSCVVAGYLAQRGEMYQLSAEGRRWLCKESPDSLVNLVAYFETLYVRWANLENSLERGGPPRPYYEAFNEDDWRIYSLGMKELARILLPRVIETITPDKEARSLLDIGGSHGLYAIECCRRRPHLHATVMDFAPALALASNFARESGVAGRVELLAGNFLTDPLPPAQDVVLMFNIIHGLSDAENRTLLARALAALRPGGKLFILDQMRQNGKSSSPIAQFIPLMVGLNLLNEIGGSVYSTEEITEWCNGYTVRQLKLRLPGVALIEVSSRQKNQNSAV
jgi:SAM-dependent methyltransferase